MPLDEFQKGIVAIISSNRDPQSAFAGGSVIQQHGFRLSDDQDIFASGDGRLDDLVHADLSVLEAAGYTVRKTRRFDGFRECLIGKPMVGSTVLQWTAGLANEYFAPVPDPLFGYRLHFADLAVNKALAAGSRTKIRDIVDLLMLDRHLMPLWRMACAVPGKRPDLNPFFLVERMSHNWDLAVRRNTADDRLVLTDELSLEEVGAGLLASLDEARMKLRDASPECYGRLEVNGNGQPVVNRGITSGGKWKAPRPGRALPSFEGIDSEMIAGLIAKYGLEGSRCAGPATPSPEIDGDTRRTERNSEHNDPLGIQDPCKLPSPWDD